MEGSSCNHFDCAEKEEQETNRKTRPGEFQGVGRFEEKMARLSLLLENEVRFCRGCGKNEGKERAATLDRYKKCNACLEVNYCSKECQTRDWRDSHKARCVIVPLLLGWLRMRIPQCGKYLMLTYCCFDFYADVKKC